MGRNIYEGSWIRGKGWRNVYGANTHTYFCVQKLYGPQAKYNSTNIKEPPCFEELDEVLSDRPTTLPIFLQYSSGNANVDDVSVSKNIDEHEEVPPDFEISNDDLTDDLLNSTHMDITTQDTQTDQPPAPTQSTSKRDSFHFNKSKKRKSSGKAMYEKMNAIINTFMSSQAETDSEFLKQMFEKPS